MKGGNYLALESDSATGAGLLHDPLPVTVVFTPDEEGGTPSARDLLEAEARRNKGQG
jgi:glutamate carboxypeptidase